MTFYEKLRQILDCHPSGCPDSPEIIEILKLILTEDEAKVACALGFKPIAVPVIAQKVGMDQQIVSDILESMANKVFVFCKKKPDGYYYCLVPIMPGVFEFPYMKNQPYPNIEKLNALWHRYLKIMAKGFGSSSTSFSRIVPIQEQISTNPDVLTYEKLYDMIDKANVVGIAKCACRESENNCDAPRETCMLFDDTCTHLVERGYGRYITKDEMKAKLKEFDDYGLIHQTNNAQDKLTFICNCCTCCCGLLRAMTEVKNPNVLMSSGFMPQCDQDKCTGCGICADSRCKMKALEMKDGFPVLNEQQCIGCALCVTGCPSEAMTLVRRQNRKTPAITNRDMGIQILKDKNKVEAFLNVMQ